MQSVASDCFPRTYFSNENIRIAQACRNFIKWNFELVASSSDFDNFHPDVLTMLLQQNDLVVQNEMVLYEYVAENGNYFSNRYCATA